ncbi:MAG: small multi-drug export protein [Treponema sp.]|nr:small multi-drug export protein [Treponema sp.]
MSRTLVYTGTAILSFLPISELRGAIPFAMANHVPWWAAFLIAVVGNCLVAPFCWIFLSTLHKLFLKMNWYKRFFERFIGRARNKLHKDVERWGWLGITVFVAIPLPLTGAWTGTLGAWVLGLSRRKTMLAVFLGVVGAGIIVTVVMVLGIHALSIFVKNAAAVQTN